MKKGKAHLELNLVSDVKEGKKKKASLSMSVAKGGVVKMRAYCP